MVCEISQHNGGLYSEKGITQTQIFKTFPGSQRGLLIQLKGEIVYNIISKGNCRETYLSSYMQVRRMRNKVTSELRAAKRSYFQKLNPKNPKEFWKSIKFLNKKQSSIPTLTDEDGNEALTGSHKAEILNSSLNASIVQVLLLKTGQKVISTLILGSCLMNLHVMKTRSVSYLQAWTHPNQVDQMASPQKC
jgi:hypothetical protein